MTTYEYRIIDGDTLARVELLDGNMTVNGAMIDKGKWIPIFPLDIIWEGRSLTAHEQATLIKPYPSSRKKIDTSSWENARFIGQTPEQILGIARGAYEKFYEANA